MELNMLGNTVVMHEEAYQSLLRRTDLSKAQYNAARERYMIDEECICNLYQTTNDSCSLCPIQKLANTITQSEWVEGCRLVIEELLGEEPSAMFAVKVEWSSGRNKKARKQIARLHQALVDAAEGRSNVNYHIQES